MLSLSSRGLTTGSKKIKKDWIPRSSRGMTTENQSTQPTAARNDALLTLSQAIPCNPVKLK
ncbi:hypothetical protein [Rickettsia sp.]|uniref:hypothetical protein n=1 Tax=Rickettsia sp. TaxID=789 RepID=UPI00397E371C